MKSILMYLLLFLSAAGWAQNPTPFNKIKITGITENNTAGWVLVEDPVTKEVHRILKSSLAQNLQSVTDVGAETDKQIVLKNPYQPTGGGFLDYQQLSFTSASSENISGSYRAGGFGMYDYENEPKTALNYANGTLQLTEGVPYVFQQYIRPSNNIMADYGANNSIWYGLGITEYDTEPNVPFLSFTRNSAAVWITNDNLQFYSINLKWPALSEENESRTLIASVSVDGTKYYADYSGDVAIPSGGGGGVTSVNAQTGVVVLNQDNIADGTVNKGFTATEKTKLAGIATGATAYTDDLARAAAVANDLTPSINVAPSKTAVNTALAEKFSIFYKSSAPFAPFSGAGVETIIGVIPINPNKLRNNTMAVCKAMIRKNNAVSSGFTLTMYLNTAPNLSGATPLRSSHTTAGTVMSSSFETEFWIEDNLMKVPNATTISNIGISSTTVNELPFNPANQYYIIITGNPGGNTAEIQCKIAQLTGTY